MNKLTILPLLAVILLAGCVQPGDGTTTQQGASATNVYFKDQANAEVKAVTVTVTRLDLRNVNGEFETVFEGETEVRLEEGLVQQVASSELETGTYNGIRVNFGDTATVEDVEGNTSTATVTRTQMVINVPQKPDSTAEEGNTVNIVVDIALENAVQVLPNGMVNFVPNADARADVWAEAGINLDSSVNGLAQARTVANVRVLNDIASKTSVGANISANVTGGIGVGN